MTILGEKSRPSILIADDHVVFLDALRPLLERTYTVIGTVTDGRALVAEAIRLKPDVIIVDIGMPLLNGFDAACRIREQLPNVRIVFLTMQDDPNLAAAAMELGNVGFVLKHSAAKELLTAIELVWHGKSFASPKLRSEDWVEQRSRVVQFSKDLTPRQCDVVQLFAEGNSLKEIAARLDLSPKTIEFHKHHIMDRFPSEDKFRSRLVRHQERAHLGRARCPSCFLKLTVEAARGMYLFEP